MPFSVFKRIAEERIREAMERGEFDDLSYKGKPLQLKEDPFVPEELKVAFRMLRNANFLPKEVEIRKEIAELEAYLDEDHQEAYQKIKKLSALLFHLNQIRQRPLQVEDEDYYAKIVERIRLYKEKKLLENKECNKIDFAKLQVLLSVKSFYFKKR